MHTYLASNLDRSAAGYETLAQGSAYAQPFRTGTAGGGYDIDGVVPPLANLENEGDPDGKTTVTIRNDNSGSPADSAFATLNTPSSTDGKAEFKVRGAVRLAPDTKYWVVAEHSTASGGPDWVRVLLNKGLDSGSAAG